MRSPRVDRTPTGVELWLALGRALRALDARAARAVGSAGLCAGDVAVLSALLRGGPQRVSALGRGGCLTSGAISSADDRLAARGLVARREVTGDRRGRVVALTRGGRALVAPALARRAAALDAAAAPLTAAERGTLAALLDRLGRDAETTTPDRLERSA